MLLEFFLFWLFWVLFKFYNFIGCFITGDVIRLKYTDMTYIHNACMIFNICKVYIIYIYSMYIPWIMLSISALLAPLSGPVCQRFSHRFSIILGSIILSSGTFISAFAGNIIHLYIFFGLMAGKGGFTVLGICCIQKELLLNHIKSVSQILFEFNGL